VSAQREPDGARWFTSKVASLGYRSYAAYLLGDHWRALRERFYADDSTPKECICGSTEDLDLHHLTYVRLGRERLDDLRPLCRACHHDVHIYARRGLGKISLEGYISDLRRSRYARERRQQLERDGRREDFSDEPYDARVWEFNARRRKGQAERDVYEAMTPDEQRRARIERANKIAAQFKRLP
jgi:hypothetical protein